jgi:hypothetical protein
VIVLVIGCIVGLGAVWLIGFGVVCLIFSLATHDQSPSPSQALAARQAAEVARQNDAHRTIDGLYDRAEQQVRSVIEQQRREQ